MENNNTTTNICVVIKILIEIMKNIENNNKDNDSH